MPLSELHGCRNEIFNAWHTFRIYRFLARVSQNLWNFQEVFRYPKCCVTPKTVGPINRIVLFQFFCCFSRRRRTVYGWRWRDQIRRSAVGLCDILRIIRVEMDNEWTTKTTTTTAATTQRCRTTSTTSAPVRIIHLRYIVHVNRHENFFATA